MDTMFSDFNGLEMVFVICSIIGGIFLVIRIIMQFIGADADTHADVGVDVDVDVDINAHHMDADVSFKLISIHGLTAFFLMFGLVGLALYRQSNMGAFISIAGGSASGLVSVWIIGKLFASIGRLQSSGTVDTVSAIGSSGEVYLTIPENGTGRVMIHVKDRLREFDASSHNKKEIKTGVPVKVVWVDGSTLVVEEKK